MSSSRRDLVLLFAGRCLRLFGFGLVSVVLALALAARGFGDAQIGLLFTLALLGDGLISLYLTTRADRWGRRRTLLLSAALILVAGAALVGPAGFWVVLVALTVGVISPSGNEMGPFLAVEQSALSQLVGDVDRTRFVAWYHVAGFCSTAAGSLVGGVLAGWLQRGPGWAAAESYRAIFAIYLVSGLGLLALAAGLSRAIEVRGALPPVAHWSGLHESRGRVARLSGLFALDAFAGGFIVQAVLAYWFHRRFGADEVALGMLFFGANILSGLSALAAVPLAKRIGLVNTMVFTHLPSNLLLIAVALVPSFPWAAGLLLARHLISQMDVPTRQSYVMAVVSPDERSAANGITGTARAFGAAVAPALAGRMLASPLWFNAPLYVAGGLKIVYDLALWALFRREKPPEEK